MSKINLKLIKWNIKKKEKKIRIIFRNGKKFNFIKYFELIKFNIFRIKIEKHSIWIIFKKIL